VGRDGVTLGSWLDTTPLATGAYLSLRTDASTVQFDDIAVSDVVKYYEASGTRVALRKAGAVSYLFGDHLGSTSVTTNASGARTGELWYKPWGESRGTPFGTTPTTYHFTGQREDASIGLYFYGARYYDSALGRFIQADTLVPAPGDPQSLNRYAYTLNNPLRYTDPTGHDAQCAAFGMNVIGYVGCEIVTDGPRLLQQIESLVVQYGPSMTQALQQMADKLPALTDQAGQLLNGAQQAGNTASPGGLDPNKWGKWVERSEAMSDRARAYQKHVTGRADGRIFQVDGVNFDGIRDGTLLDAKGYYKQFVDPSTGSFKTWWQGANDIAQQAQRQMEAAKGIRIEWHFNEVETLEAVRKLFAEKGIGQDINLILDQMP
jgi:RHS repeat-associated protein